MSAVKKIFAQKECIYGHDLSKRWYIAIKIPDTKKGALAWKRCYGDINKFKTVKERIAAMKIMAAEIEAMQGYFAAQGSRKVGLLKVERVTTSVISQFYRLLRERSHRLRVSSVRRYTGLIKNLEAWLLKGKRPDIAVGLLTNVDAKCFLQWLINEDFQSGGSHNHHLQLFSGFYKDMILEGLAKTNPFAGIKRMATQNVPALYFSTEQVGILKPKFIACDPQLWLFVNFVYYAFIRPGELRQLKIGDINFKDARIRVRPEMSKNKKLQYVSIPAQLVKLLNDKDLQNSHRDMFVFGRKGIPGPVPIGKNAMKIRHQAILKDLGFSINHKLYSWKHTGAIACARAGMPLKDLQMQLRHHSLDQVDKYLRGMMVWESDFIKHNYPSI